MNPSIRNEAYQFLQDNNECFQHPSKFVQNIFESLTILINFLVNRIKTETNNLQSFLFSLSCEKNDHSLGFLSTKHVIKNYNTTAKFSSRSNFSDKLQGLQLNLEWFCSGDLVILKMSVSIPLKLLLSKISFTWKSMNNSQSSFLEGFVLGETLQNVDGIRSLTYRFFRPLIPS